MTLKPQYELFLERLLALRTEKGLAQTEVAERLGVPQQYISRFEQGETRMDVVQLWRYCNAVGVSFGRFCAELGKVLSGPEPRRASRRRASPGTAGTNPAAYRRLPGSR